MTPHQDPDDRIALLRLKEYERPEPDFAENFLKQFQERQRAELLKRSSLSLFWERVQQWHADLGLKKILIPAGMAGAAAAFVLMSSQTPHEFSGGTQTAAVHSPAPAPVAAQPAADSLTSHWPSEEAAPLGRLVRVSDFNEPTSLLPSGPLDHLTEIVPSSKKVEEPDVKYRLIPPPLFDQEPDEAHSLR